MSTYNQLINNFETLKLNKMMEILPSLIKQINDNNSLALPGMSGEISFTATN